MRLLFIGDNDPETLELVSDLAGLQVEVSRDPAFESVDAVVAGVFTTATSVPSLAACRALRVKTDLPIIALVARNESGEQILGQRTGVDDYLSKPYSAGVLIARVEAVRRLRERRFEPSQLIEIEDVVIDLRCRSVTVAGKVIELARKEFQILALLSEEAGGVCRRSSLHSRVWGDFYVGVDETLNVHIASLRAKIGRRHLIETVRGVGYRLALPIASVTC